MHITAPNQEKIWTLLGPKFSKDKGRQAIVARDLYGLKSASAAFRSHLADYMRQLGFGSNKADSDLWMRSKLGIQGATLKNATCILIYVDDRLCVHDDPD